MSIDSNAYAGGTKIYTTAQGTYNVDLGKAQVSQSDVDRLDRLASSGHLRQADLIEVMQKYDGLVFVDEQKRELTTPSMMLQEDPNWKQIDDDIGSIFAEATRQFALAAQASRQQQMEAAEASRKDILTLAVEVKSKDLEAAAAAKRAAVTEAAVGIAGGAVGVLGGGYGIYKAGKGQRAANAGSTKQKLANDLDTQTEKSKLDLEKGLAATNKSFDKAALRKSEVDNLAHGKRGDIARLERQQDTLTTFKNAPANKNKDLKALDDKFASNAQQLKTMKPELQKLDDESKSLDVEMKGMRDGHQAAHAKHRELEVGNSEKSRKLHLEADKASKDAASMTEWGRMMGQIFNAFSQGTTAAGKGAAAADNFRADTLRAESKFVEAQKASMEVMQSQHSELAGHGGDMFRAAVDSAQTVQRGTQDMLNSAAHNMA
ncbi:MAG: hypothetical protein EOO28_16330 [Comamonadaceae bacterium]|nr:MAG: hypothetical protein EOO28_16330 [Comamonadaceae bacterium]